MDADKHLRHQEISLHLTPPSLPPISEKEGGSDGVGHLEPLSGPILDQPPSNKCQKPENFGACGAFFSFLPLEIIKICTPECKTLGRRRRIFSQNTSRNHPKPDFFRPPEAARPRTSRSSKSRILAPSSEKEGGVRWEGGSDEVIYPDPFSEFAPDPTSK